MSLNKLLEFYETRDAFEEQLELSEFALLDGRICTKANFVSILRRNKRVKKFRKRANGYGNSVA